MEGWKQKQNLCHLMLCFHISLITVWLAFDKFPLHSLLLRSTRKQRHHHIVCTAFGLPFNKSQRKQNVCTINGSRLLRRTDHRAICRTAQCCSWADWLSVFANNWLIFTLKHWPNSQMQSHQCGWKRNGFWINFIVQPLFLYVYSMHRMQPLHSELFFVAVHSASSSQEFNPSWFHSNWYTTTFNVTFPRFLTCCCCCCYFIFFLSCSYSCSFPLLLYLISLLFVMPLLVFACFSLYSVHSEAFENCLVMVMNILLHRCM